MGGSWECPNGDLEPIHCPLIPGRYLMHSDACMYQRTIPPVGDVCGYVDAGDQPWQVMPKAGVMKSGCARFVPSERFATELYTDFTLS